jgi:hypothetical protein cdivTM_02431
MSKNNAQEQIIAKLKESESILIAVNDNPSVDELSSALALTLAINNSGKHATAVASGEMPDALTFLRPEKTFEHSVDSLRDFIIALNKEKADHLRYKLVGDHVKIFITPYRSIISEKDLEFEQGDFNVDFVLALNVESQDRLDGALAAHGRIFHDASVAILTIGENQTNLNGTHWHAENASSLSELTVQIIESLGKKNLTQPVATALLTGIVAETDRFSNAKATAEVMSLAAKLISSGADQQLVVSKIREAEEKAGEFAVQKNAKMEEAFEELSGEKEDKKQVSKTEQKRDGAFVIAHEEAKDEAKKAEDELEESLNELKNINTPENAFAELDEAETFEQNQETSQGSSNEEIFENPSKDFKEEQSQNENSTQSSIEDQEILADQNVPTFENSQPQTFEPTEPQITQPEVAPVFEQQNPVEISAQPEIEQAIQSGNTQGLVEGPIQNYAPEIPAPSVPFENPNAFIAEAPVQGQVFEPARQVEISVPTFENSQPQTFEPTEPQIAQPEVAPVFEQQNSAETSATQEIQTQNIQPVQNQGDEYYHPAENAQIASGLMGAQPYEPSGISRGENSAATSNPQNNDYVLSHGKVQNAVYEEPRANENFIPETQPYAQATPIQPLSNFESSNPISNEQYAQTLPQNNFENQQTYSTETPAQNSNDFVMPLPPAMPDFSSMPMPPEVPAFDFIPNPAEQPAMGTENSKNKVMTDQIYPNDPSQFRIPGM